MTRMATEVLPDDRALRAGRRERAFAQMAAHDLDVLVLGRQANVRYVAGAPQLWVAGTRPFGPTCVVVRETGAIHLLSTWDEGVPDDIPHENLYGITWNPMNTISVLQRIDGAATTKHVGTEALSPGFAQLLPMAFPNAELVDGEPAMRDARRVKTPEEVHALREATRVAEHALAAAVDELRPGVSENALAGVLLEAMTAGGVSTPSTQDVAWVTSREHPWRRGSDDGRVRSGDLLALSAGVLAGGYTGEVGRTWPVGEPDGAPDLYRRWEALWHRLYDACRPEAPTSDEVEPVADQRIQTTRAEFTDLGFQRIDLARRENSSQQLAVDVVQRRVLEDHDARRHLDVRLDQLEDRPPRRAESLVIDQRPVDIGEPAQRIEVVLLVVVQGRFLAKPAKHPIRVSVELNVVRVAVDVAGSADCHRYRLSANQVMDRSYAVACELCHPALPVPTPDTFMLLRTLGS